MPNRQLQAGNKITRLPVREINEAIGEAHRREWFGNRSPPAEADRQFAVSVRNTTDEVIDIYQAIGLEDPVIDPVANEAEFLSEVHFDGVEPTFNHVSRFGLTLEPIHPGDFGRCLLYGVSAAKVDFVSLDHRFCQPLDGSHQLTSVDFGCGRILWPTNPTSLGEQWAIVFMTGSGQATTGERVSGRLITPINASLGYAGHGREPGTGLLQVYKTDPDNKLRDQTRNRYTVTGVTPTDPADLPAGQSFQIGIDVRYRLVVNHPLQLIESTSRDGTYRVVELPTWDPIDQVCTIKVEPAIAEVLDPVTSDPVVDGTLLIPGGGGRIPSDRFVMVENFSNESANANAWLQAVHDGIAYQMQVAND